VSAPRAGAPVGPPVRRAAVYWQWVRHHLVSVLTTAADFGVMIACVELAHLAPVPATVVGALVGAVTNFTLNRVFTYHATEAALAGQTWRYAVVSGASLGLNAAGEHLFADVLGWQYVVARVVTSVIVSNFWNYPLQRFFVFSARRSQASAPPR
jgi:putative flippase GtrA